MVFFVANLSDREAGQSQSPPKEGKGATEREAERTTVQHIAYEYHRISILYIYYDKWIMYDRSYIAIIYHMYVSYIYILCIISFDIFCIRQRCCLLSPVKV